MSIPNARLRQHRQLLRENADCTVGSGSLISTAFRGGATVHYRQNFGPIADSGWGVVRIQPCNWRLWNSIAWTTLPQ